MTIPERILLPVAIGAGLGLLIVQRCVALHGDDLRFESVEGAGTTFTVSLPLFTQTHSV